MATPTGNGASSQRHYALNAVVVDRRQFFTAFDAPNPCLSGSTDLRRAPADQAFIAHIRLSLSQGEESFECPGFQVVPAVTEIANLTKFSVDGFRESYRSTNGAVNKVVFNTL
ncbi:hypothetical protein E4U21_002511 [Claviceps maximensis]|nr:hypothetical protein E4U21_002511 [Claviceps maximensis]